MDGNQTYGSDHFVVYADVNYKAVYMKLVFFFKNTVERIK